MGRFWGKNDVVLSEAVLLQGEPIFTLLFGVQTCSSLIALRGKQGFKSAWEKRYQCRITFCEFAPSRRGSYCRSVSTPGVVLKHTYRTQALRAPDSRDSLAEAQHSAFVMAR